MKSLEEIKVSVYENVYSKKPQVMSFLEVIRMCIQPVYAANINTIRRYHKEGDHEAAQKLKSKLRCFTPAGTFDGAHAIRNFRLHSHLIGLDYDHVANRLEVIRLCDQDPHTVAAIESPTDGVKIFAYVENIEGHHREAQQVVSRYYNQLLGLESDPACKDESRLCYFSYSPNGYVAALYQSFVLETATISGNAAPVAECSVPDMPVGLPPAEAAGSASEDEIQKFLSSYIFLYPLTPGYRHTHLCKLVCEACRRHYPQEILLRELTVYFEGSDFTVGELKSILVSGYKKVNEKTYTPGTSDNFPVQRGQTVKRSKGQDSPFSEQDEADEAYWQGEEFRKRTPFFPDVLYTNLPGLLSDCMVDDCTPRERDISYLSHLVSLSSVLPCTFGIYNHKKYSPHLYGIVISPAGSGKSITQTGRYLLEEIHAQILSTSEHQYKTYKKERILWQIECAKNRKNGSACSSEPEEPPFKMLFIPATTSYTRMQIQMKANADQGSIIFDTEAQTLSTANHLDCGNFDDMLRKGFEHENIDSSYKVNGMIPICIPRPKLALFLTGTAGQVSGFLNSSENGLASRILYYTYRTAPHWKTMSDESESLEDAFKPLAHRVFEMYHFCLNHPALFHFSRKQWNRLNGTFSKLLSEVALEGNDDLQAVVKRYAFMVMRVSMIHTRIRQFETNNTNPEIYCSDMDFDHSLQFVLCCYEHGRLLLSSMSSAAPSPLKNPDITRDFINDLPDTFTTEDAIHIGAMYHFSPRKVTRLLNALNNLKFKKLSHGFYEKTPGKESHSES